MASSRKSASPRTSKAIKLKDLKSTSVSGKKAGAVKGGGRPKEPGGALNHNQALLG